MKTRPFLLSSLILPPQQIHFPTNPQQPGPIYFKTLQKCGIFGVCCEALPCQINYLIHESVVMGKWANTTVSYLHDFLQNHGADKKVSHFHADNCGCQNKNNHVLWYRCWRVIHDYTNMLPTLSSLQDTWNLALIGVLGFWNRKFVEHLFHCYWTSWKPLGAATRGTF